MEDRVVEAILHYQSNLDKYFQRNDEDKMVYCMSRLGRLPITVAHLEKTGVGRTVNSMRKLSGKVGDAAKKLVGKWKNIVEEEEEEQEKKEIELAELKKKKHKNKHKHSSHKRDKHKDEEKKHKHEKHKYKVEVKSEEEAEENPADELEPENDDSSHKKHKVKKKKSHHHKEKLENHKLVKKTSESDDECEETFIKKSKDQSLTQENASPKEKTKRKRRDSSSEDTKHKGKQSQGSQASQSVETSNKKHKMAAEESIDCESGASFAEALGMMCPTTSYSSNNCKKDKKDRDKRHSTSKSDHGEKKSKSKSSPSKSSTTSSSKSSDSGLNGNSHKEMNQVASGLMPRKSSEPLDINLSSLLPQISTNYKPLGLSTIDFNLRNNSSNRYNKDDDAALTRLMYSKQARTKVYSGNKSFYGKLPSLFELCTRVLQDNIDALEYTGGVPYSILKPVLEKATAQQLFTLEHHNAYIMEESDELWYYHCQKQFKTQGRQEMETWRDMYLRCLDERDAKLKALTANIKLSQDKAVPVRQTKLAYVDSVVKPPRNVAKKQAKNGVESRPSAKLNSIAMANTSTQVAVPNPAPTQRNSSSGGNSSLKPKKAPLMQKTLQLMKGRFRR